MTRNTQEGNAHAPTLPHIDHDVMWRAQGLKGRSTVSLRAGRLLRLLLQGFAPVIAFLALMLVSPGWAGEAKPVGVPAVEERVRRLSEELRCLTCMGQSIADSNSGFSEDMRREIRKLVEGGRTDREIIDFMVQRYGDFVLYRPPVKPVTWVLWVGPFVLLAAGVTVLLIRLRRRDEGPEEDLSREEAAKAASLLARQGGRES